MNQKSWNSTRPIVGDPSVDVAQLAASLWRKTTKTDSCWLWGGSMIRDGYGHIAHRRRWFATHRLSYELAFGPIPDGLRVLHRCDTPACVRPDHLFLGTGKDNYRDMVAKGRMVSPGTRGEQNGLAKLKEEQVIEIRRRGALGEERRLLAIEFGMSVSAITDILNGRRWRHLLSPEETVREA